MAAHMQNLTPKLALQLAAPHTWAASIMPVLMACAFAYAATGCIHPLPTLVLLAIAVLMQSAVNTLNDYFDFAKGTDAEGDGVAEDDAVLVYNDVPPKQALALAIAFLAAAFALGIPCIMRAGWVPLLIAAIGALIAVLYSGGRTPISYLPLGELASGITMGGLITLASYQVMTLRLDPMVALWSLPLIAGIALIMLANNACDVEKDARAGRRTLPVIIGHGRAIALFRALLVAWLASIALIVCIWFTAGAVVLPFMLLAAHSVFNALWRNPFVPASRIAAMSQVTSANLLFGAFYAASVFASAAVLAS